LEGFGLAAACGDFREAQLRPTIAAHEMRNELQASKQKEKGQMKQKETWLKRARVFGKTSSRSNTFKTRYPFLF
jgi:hypothetical protein